jgi:hypothetical protein
VKSRGVVIGMLTTWALAASLPAAALAQAPVYAASATTSPDSILDAVLVREIERARLRGIPAAPLLAKVREGRLKRAPGARIRLAVSALATRLDTARAALGADATGDELVAGADALSAGASAAALRAVRAAAPNRSIAAPLGALAQLVASGVPAPRATSMIVELLHRNATPAQVLAFGNSVESDAAGGVPAEESAVFRLHGIGSSGQRDALSAPTAATDPRALSGTSLRPPPNTTPKRRP